MTAALYQPGSDFRWPAEWEPMVAIWLAWPHNLQTWPGRFPHIPQAFTRFIRQVAEVLPVELLVPPHAATIAACYLKNVGNVTTHDCPTNDCWIRDYGPTFVQAIHTGKIHGIDWQYNCWGGKYPPWDDDAAAAAKICGWAGVDAVSSPLTVEGGALEGDGQGRLLTTRSCLVTDSRNPGWNQNDIARELHRCLGVTEILWLDEGGLDGDDTDGHIDQIARFIDPMNVVVAASTEPGDPSYAALQRNLDQLQIWGRQTEPSVQVHALPCPPPRWIDGQRVPESYCNFLFLGDQAVLVPQFRNPATDRVAVSMLRNLLPRMEVIGVDAADLAWGLGALHCASQQQPQPITDTLQS